MKRLLFFFAAALLCCIHSHAQLRVYSNSNEGVEDGQPAGSPQGQEGMRKINSTTIYTRVFTYDAAGNRILMSTLAQNAPSSPQEELPSDDRVSLTVTTGMLRVSLAGEAVEPYSIAVYNTVGQIVARRDGCRGGSQDISLSHLKRGIYIVDVCTGDRHVTRKFTKE